jgi:flagellar biosynthesis/type III secretory pathway chaperone
MSDHFSDEQIAAIRKQADDLLAKLELTDEERDWSQQTAKVIFDETTDAHTSIPGEQYGRIRPVAAAAAAALAMITLQAWVQRIEQDNRPHN